MPLEKRKIFPNRFRYVCDPCSFGWPRTPVNESELPPPPAHSCQSQNRPELKAVVVARETRDSDTTRLSPWPSARDAELFHTLQTSSTDSVDRWSQGRDASESMGALSTLTIGNNVIRVLWPGAKERLVAAAATARAGCTPAKKDEARNACGKDPPFAGTR
jgi:hypothetical protein